MGRTIRAGSSVQIVAGDTPRFGEIWAFCNPEGSVVVHRYLGGDGGGYRFQGDASGADLPASPELIIGRVAAVERRGVVRTVRRSDRWIGGARLRALNAARPAARALPPRARRALLRLLQG